MKFLDRVYKSKTVFKLIEWSKQVYINRKLKVSIFDFFIHLRHELKKNDILSESQGVAFSFTLAIFPGIIFLFTMIPFFPIENFDQKIMLFLEENIPPKFFEVAAETIESIIQDIVVKQRTDLLSFGFIFAMFAATNGMMGLVNAFNKCYRTKEKRGFIKTRLVAFVLTFIFVGVLFVSMFIIVFSKGLAQFLEHYRIVHDVYLVAVNTVDSLLLVIVFFLIVSLIYYVAPTLHKRFGVFSLGAIVATFCFVLSSWAFSYYINNFSSYNKLYGSIGTMIGVMLWLQILSLVILLGFEINAALDRAKAEKIKLSENN